MLNIVEKYSVDTAVESEDGVVAIEYVIVAAAVVAALGRSSGPSAKRLCGPAEHHHPGHLIDPGGGHLPPSPPGPSAMNRSINPNVTIAASLRSNFVIVLPILLMLIIGTVVLGSFLNLKTQTSGLARDGARDAALRQAPRAGTVIVAVAACASSDPTDGHGHRASHEDRDAAEHPPSSRPAPGHHHGNGDHAMRRMIDTQRDDSGVATIFVVMAMTAMVVGAAFAIDVGGYVAAARSAQNSADATVLAVATDCALTGAPIADYSPYRKDGQTITTPACGSR
jgi:Flp pilus assembly protein TadG